MKIVNYLTLLSLSIFLASCTSPSFNNRDKQYLTAISVPPMRTPPGLSSDAFQSKYPVSNHRYATSPDVGTTPPGLTDNQL